jgi:hypothetical protein
MGTDINEAKFGIPPAPEAIVWCLPANNGRSAEEVFDDELAVAYLLMHGVLFVNSAWWEKEWPEKARSIVHLFCNCNDVFAWGCSDAEPVEMDDIRAIYEHYRKDRCWGTAVWACKKRNQMPQKPVAEAIRKQGVWHLDDLGLKLSGNREYGI